MLVMVGMLVMMLVMLVMLVILPSMFTVLADPELAFTLTVSDGTVGWVWV